MWLVLLSVVVFMILLFSVCALFLFFSFLCILLFAVLMSTCLSHDLDAVSRRQ